MDGNVNIINPRHTHVDVHFVREHQLETKSIYVHRVPSAENSADMMSKNVTPQLQQKHSRNAMGESKL